MLPNMYRCFTGLYEAAAQRSAMLPAPVAGGNIKVKVFGGDGKVWFGGKRVRGKLAMWEEDDVGSSGDKWDWVDGVSGYGDGVYHGFVFDGSDNFVYESDDASLGATSFYVTGAQTWGVSNVGRMSPSSLRYFGIGLENGNYAVTLQFAEFDFPDGRKSHTATRKQYIVPVTKNFLEIHLFWAGKGTCCIPTQGYYGPRISALSATPSTSLDLK
ncbi:putative LRR receptor-like serine/threonine-protein kinase [Hordeum vulgare]|nr:putative LRR receptor-like serine/threonine-protein kinase [Hordeum vulgare]